MNPPPLPKKMHGKFIALTLAGTVALFLVVLVNWAFNPPSFLQRSDEASSPSPSLQILSRPENPPPQPIQIARASFLGAKPYLGAEGRGWTIIGYVTNNTPTPISFVKASFTIIDFSGNAVGKASDSITDLPGYTQWKFEARVPVSEYDHYTFDGLTIY